MSEHKKILRKRDFKLEQKKIAIIGLGYVGLPLAVEFGKTRLTLGFDISASRIKELLGGNDKTLEVSEKDLKEAAHLGLSSNPEDLNDCKIFIVTVPTPIDDVNRPDLTSIIKASDELFLKRFNDSFKPDKPLGI